MTMPWKNKRTLLIIFVLFLLAGTKFVKSIHADARCGTGYICWEANGGEMVVHKACEWNTTGGYCQGAGGVPDSCNCVGSANCNCTISGLSTCDGVQPKYPTKDIYTCPTPRFACDFAHQCDINIGGSIYPTACNKTTVTNYDAVPTCPIVGELPKITIGCCYNASVTNTPAPSGGGNPTATPTAPPPGSTPTSTPNPSFSPTPSPIFTPFFLGNVYNDANATTVGLGGTDNLCTGNTTSANPGANSSVSISRPGESNAITATSSYNITTSTVNNDYTITLDLPNPPPNPANAWQCACNADPSDPYRCIYTNQAPPDIANFYIYRANLNNNSWWQTLGGNIYSETNIGTNIPSATCIAPDCVAALIGRDTAGLTNSAGFPATNGGEITTTVTGDTYIHEADGRTNSLQGQAQGVAMPTEGYDFFNNKFGSQAVTHTGREMPDVENNSLNIFKHVGNLVIEDATPWIVANKKKIIVFVEGNLIFRDLNGGNHRLTRVTYNDTFLMFIVQGDVFVRANVGWTNINRDTNTTNVGVIQGVIVADGAINIEGYGSAQDRKFVGEGSFVGWNGIVLDRDFNKGVDSPTDNNEDATETFIYRPDLMVNTPQIIKSSHINWQEVAPRWGN